MSFSSQPMILAAVLHMFNLQTRTLVFSRTWKVCPINICKAPQPPTNPSCPATSTTKWDSVDHCCTRITACQPGQFIKQLPFCGAGTPVWITSPGEMGCACLTVSIWLHPSSVILANSPCFHSGFICTGLVKLDGFEQTLESLCVAEIYLIKEDSR